VAAPCGSPAVPHLHRYYGFVRLLLHPYASASGFPRRLRFRSCERRWRALLGSWGIPLEACPELGTPAIPERPRNVGRPDAAFRLVNSVGIAISRFSELNLRGLLPCCVRFAPTSRPVNGNTRYRPACSLWPCGTGTRWTPLRGFTVSSSAPPLPSFSQRDNNVGAVKQFLSRPLQSLKRVFSSGCWVVFLVGLDHFGSFLIWRSAPVRPMHLFDRKLQTMISFSNSLSRGSGRPIQVDGVLVHAMSGTELSRVRTEFRLRLPEPLHKRPLESRGRHCYAIKWNLAKSGCPVTHRSAARLTGNRRDIRKCSRICVLRLRWRQAFYLSAVPSAQHQNKKYNASRQERRMLTAASAVC
jgi:hypothetical protein